MSTRRKAASRDPIRLRTQPRIPAHLAMGPCIEVWAADYKPSRYEVAFPAYHARRAWRRAGDEWAERAEISRPFNWPNLARTRVPWSREYLQAAGRADLADYYENGGEHPGGLRETR